MARLEGDALRICARFGLRYRVLEAERANVKRRYGVCFSDGTIRIRLLHVTTKKPLKYSSLISTLCHELAHLRHFNHGPRFQNLYAQILEWARRERIYQPSPKRPQRIAEPTAARSPISSPAPDAVAVPIASPPSAPNRERRRPRARPPIPGQLELFG